MTLPEKNFDWKALSDEVKSILGKHRDAIPAERVSDIEHYLEHGEIGAAFEYLVLEIIDLGERQPDVELNRLNEIALFFGLNDENECMIDGNFWSRLQNFVLKT